MWDKVQEMPPAIYAEKLEIFDVPYFLEKTTLMSLSLKKDTSEMNNFYAKVLTFVL